MTHHDTDTITAAPEETVQEAPAPTDTRPRLFVGVAGAVDRSVLDGLANLMPNHLVIFVPNMTAMKVVPFVEDISQV